MEVPVAVIHPPSVPVINLHIAKVQIPNSAYEARLDWRKKKNAMRRAAVGSEARFAIVQGLWWLARHQDLDGKWSAAKFTVHCGNSRNCADHSAPSLSDEAITATALLAMLGDGHTPSQGKFRAHVARGIQWLQSRQQPDGAIGEATNRNKHFLLGHAIATAALAEAYGITGEARYRASAQKAVGYLLEHDITVIDEKLQVKTANIGLAAVRMAALGAAEIARLDLTRGSATAAARRLAGIRDIQASVYTSQAPSAMTTRPAITVGMLALLDPTSKPDDSLLNGEAPRMREHMPDWETNGQTYWLCGSIVAKRIGKNVWWRWNQALQKTLSKHQVKRGHAIGSWQANDPTTKLGGRVFATALSVLALETPYR
ncbi:MAG: hypothetical protein HQ592_00755 [Planctomycetes bacterium]|nr:hypothetical protein [Planctomycetota bacterium]